MAPLAKPLILATSAALVLSALLHADPATHTDDHALIRSLLSEGLDERTFSFATVIESASGKKVLPLLPENKAHQRVQSAIEAALRKSIATLNQPDSPVRTLRRINEASRFFEDELLTHLNQTEGLHCEIPKNHNGQLQRSGYPDLRITDTASGLVFYLDPKLVEKGSETSSFRTFYYEPRTRTGKILDDAVHLLIGIEHDGKNGEWTFSGWRLVDLSTTRLRLKAEFQTSNAELYRKSGLSTASNPE
jgi:hypothetical protein